ncbi:MAG: flagellar assembly peptidoglycan hydrolase FlgJ [Gammaproteobacteria bacterium]
MNVNPDIYLDMTGLAKLHGQAQRDSPKALKQVAQQFEALFVQMMLKSMRSATLAGGKGIMDSNQTRFYQGMFDKQIALDISKGKGIGLAKMLEQQLGKNLPKSTGNTGGTQSPAGVSVSPSAAQAPAVWASANGPESKPAASPAQFVASVWPHAQATARKLGVDPKVLVAQAALETGWGKGTIRNPDGSSSHNLFGIKAGGQWQGPSATVTTLEFKHGIPTPQQAAFRAYGSPAASFADYAKFLQSNPRYRHALSQSQDPKAFVQALQQAGYATDPNYARKLLDILHSPTLQDAVAGVKTDAGRSLT